MGGRMPARGGMGTVPYVGQQRIVIPELFPGDPDAPFDHDDVISARGADAQAVLTRRDDRA
jgi:hypothetical protein